MKTNEHNKVVPRIHDIRITSFVAYLTMHVKVGAITQIGTTSSVMLT
jgi:hypothetical protein